MHTHTQTHLFTGSYSLKGNIYLTSPRLTDSYQTVSCGMAILLNSKYIYNTFQISLLQLLKAIIHGIISEIVLISVPIFLASNDKFKPTIYKYISSLKAVLSSWR